MADSATNTQKSKTDQQVSDEFTSYYLQRVTKEFAEDLDTVRNADDFKSDAALPLLISALQQGAALFSPDEQRRIVTAEAPPTDGGGEKKDKAEEK